VFGQFQIERRKREGILLLIKTKKIKQLSELVYKKRWHFIETLEKEIKQNSKCNVNFNCFNAKC
jgi:hypothetical protein